MPITRDNLDTLLSELGRQHRSTEAPAALEPLLRAAAERAATATALQRDAARLTPVRRWPSLAWAVTAAAVLLVLAGVFEGSLHRGPQHTSPDAPLQAIHPPAPPAATTQVSAPPRAALLPTSSSTSRHARPPKPAADTDAQQAWQSDFVALPASEGLAPATAISLVRLRIQQSSLQQYGLEVPAESSAQTLLAEFMVGEDGLPRAVRILQ